MRIDNNKRISGPAGRPAVRGGSGAPFTLDLAAETSHAAGVAAPASVGGIDALLALQAVADPMERRRRAVRRGRDLLDTLDALRTDLLVGRISEPRVELLLRLLSEAREDDDPGLHAVIDDIELRARVELAKRGRYLPG